ncbi:MAG: hypothetical protein HZA17_10200, partial [Nitrospirae bacterium]|nr:hypothetical protein [Nitrospirota bacterium]
LRSISDNVEVVTEDVKRFSRSVSDVGETVSLINGLIATVSSSATVKVFSFRAGLQAAVAYLLSNLIKKGDRK